LTEKTLKIQKVWRGFRIRKQFIKELNMINEKNEITKKKIENLDSKFWGEGRNSDSVMKVEDE
jgi:predicted DNA-binding ribbon-helix-helix protein